MKVTKSDSLILLGVLCLAAGVGFLGFGLFLIPFAFFGMTYEIPLSVMHVITWLESHYNITGHRQALLMVIPLFVTAMMFFILAGVIAHYQQQPHRDDGVTTRRFAFFSKRETMRDLERPRKYNVPILIKVLALITLVLIIITFFEYILTVDFGGIF